MARGKHHYTIKKITYDYEGDYFDFDTQTKKEEIIFTTNKREKADRFYEHALTQECGTIYKSIYYPVVEIVFVRDY